jgi:hypothetical protein
MTEPTVQPDAVITTVTGTWIWWSNQSSVPPSTKQVRSNTANWVSATQLHFSNTDNAGVDRSPGLDSVKPGDTIRLEHSTDSTRWATFLVSTNPSVLVGYHTFPVTCTGSNGALPGNSTLLSVTFNLSQATMPSPVLGHMYIDLTMVPETDQSIANNLMDLIGDRLKVVTHLVNHADFKVNVAGVILTYSADVLPAMQGPPAALPTEEITV